MGNSVYQINKGINKSIEFKGLKAQYIWYLGAGVVGLLILFVLMYILGVHSYLCIAVIMVAGSVLVTKVYALSNKYGEHGLMKMMARKNVPKVIRSRDRRLFIHLKRSK